VGGDGIRSKVERLLGESSWPDNKYSCSLICPEISNSEGET
jgi:hypothetical protein